MSEHKNIAISLPIDVYERVEKLAPRKKHGRNDVRDFYTRIFMLGVESADFIKLENRRLETKIKILESLGEQRKTPIDSSSLNSVARDFEIFQDMATKQPEAKPVPDSPAASAPEAEMSTDKKSTVH